MLKKIFNKIKEFFGNIGTEKIDFIDDNVISRTEIKSTLKKSSKRLSGQIPENRRQTIPFKK